VEADAELTGAGFDGVAHGGFVGVDDAFFAGVDDGATEGRFGDAFGGQGAEHDHLAFGADMLHHGKRPGVAECGIETVDNGGDGDIGEQEAFFLLCGFIDPLKAP
jgi:hypothetical protein